MNNMKKVSLGIVVGLVATMTFMPAKVQANDDLQRLAVALCESAKANKRSAMRKKLDQAGVRLKDIYDGLKCGAEGRLLRVATNAGSMQAAKYIVTKARKSALSSVGSDGNTIIQYTEKLVAGGDASKQEFVDYFKSKS